MMQQCNLDSYKADNGSRHLIPPSQLEQYLADCDAEKSTHPDAQQWCWETEKPKAFNINTILANTLSEYKNDCAILLLEDPIGLMNELSGAFISIANQQQAWFGSDENSAKYFAASQIKMLMTLQEKHFLKHSKDNTLNAYINQHFREVDERYNAYTQSYETVRNERIQKEASKSGYYYRGESLTSEAERQYAQQLTLNQALANKIGVSGKQLEKLFKQVREQQLSLLEGGMGHRGILDRIKEDEMETWFKPAHEKIVEWQKQLEALDDDRLAMLRPAYLAMPVFDKENKEALLARLKIENHWYITSLINKRTSPNTDAFSLKKSVNKTHSYFSVKKRTSLPLKTKLEKMKLSTYWERQTVLCRPPME